MLRPYGSSPWPPSVGGRTIPREITEREGACARWTPAACTGRPAEVEALALAFAHAMGGDLLLVTVFPVIELHTRAGLQGRPAIEQSVTAGDPVEILSGLTAERDLVVCGSRGPVLIVPRHADHAREDQSRSFAA
jgi:hypothetical protein